MSVPSRRTLLVVSGGIEAVPGIRRAQELGLHVVVSDGFAEAPGMAVGDEALVASTYDIEATVATARVYSETQRPIDGVICIASDVPLTVASVAADLGLPGIPLEAAGLAMDKLAMKRRFADDGVAIPWFREVGAAAQLRELVEEVGLPLVIKPVDSRGARGVLLLDDPDADLAWAFGVARDESPTGRVMVERFLPGAQISTESLVVDGVAHTIGFADRNYEQLARFAPYIIEDGGQLPTFLEQEDRTAVATLIQQATDSLGVRTGVIKGDIVMGDSGPVIIEVALRLSGGYLCTHEIPLSTGVDFVGNAIRLAMGESLAAADLEPTASRGVAQRWLFPSPGTVRNIRGVEGVTAWPDVALCEIRVSEGDVVPEVHSHPARAGVVIATAETREAAITQAERAVAAIEIETT